MPHICPDEVRALWLALPTLVAALQWVKTRLALRRALTAR